MNWEPLATRNPVPGDPVDVRAVGEDYSKAAKSLSSAVKSVDEIPLDDQYSKAVTKLVKSAKEERTNLDAVATRYSQVGEALVVYAAALGHAQDEAEKLRIKAVTAQQSQYAASNELTAAKKALETAELAEQTDGTPVPWPVRNRVTTATAAVKQHGSAIATAQADLAVVVSAWRAAAKSATSVIRTTVKKSPLNDKWYQKPWLVKIAKMVSKVADWVATIAGVLALITAWIPVIGQVIAAIALTAAIVGIISKTLLAAAGEQSWRAVVLEVGLLLFTLVGGRLAGKYAAKYAGKLGEAAATQAKRVKTAFNKTNPAHRTHSRALCNPAKVKALSRYQSPWKIARNNPQGKWAQEYGKQFARGWREGVDSFKGLSTPEKVFRALGIGDDALLANRHVRQSDVNVAAKVGNGQTLLNGDSPLVDIMSKDRALLTSIVIDGLVVGEDVRGTVTGAHSLRE